LHTLLFSDEELIFAVEATLNKINSRTLFTLGSGMLVLTNKRVIFYQKKITGATTLEQFPISQIVSSTYHQGFVQNLLHVRTTNGNIEFSCVKNKVVLALQFNQLLQSLIIKNAHYLTTVNTASRKWVPVLIAGIVVSAICVGVFQQKNVESKETESRLTSSGGGSFDFNGKTVNKSPKLAMIPGLAPVDVYMNFTNKGFKLTRRLNVSQCIYSCINTSSGNTLTVDVYGKTPEDVNTIEAAYASYESSNEAAKDFLGYVATMQYENAAPQIAKDWVRNNIGRHATTYIGGVKFETFSKGEVRMLVMSVGDEK
jgi:hypothetical protein